MWLMKPLTVALQTRVVPLQQYRTYRSPMQIIDIYTHIFPDAFYQAFTKAAPRLGPIGARLRGVKPIYDLDLRFREMDVARRGLLPDHLAAQSADRGCRSEGDDLRAVPRRQRRDGGVVPQASRPFPRVRRRDQPRRSAGGREGRPPRCEGSRRARLADFHQRRRPPARSRRLRAGVRDGRRARPAAVDASRAHRRRHDRLQERSEIALRDVVVLRLADGDQRRDVPAGVLGAARPLSQAEDRHAPLRRLHPVLRRPRRPGAASARLAHARRGLLQSAVVAEASRTSTTSRISTATPRCSAAPSGSARDTSSSAPTTSCSRPTRRSARSRPRSTPCAVRDCRSRSSTRSCRVMPNGCCGCRLGQAADAPSIVAPARAQTRCVPCLTQPTDSSASTRPCRPPLHRARTAARSRARFAQSTDRTGDRPAAPRSRMPAASRS